MAFGDERSERGEEEGMRSSEGRFEVVKRDDETMDSRGEEANAKREEENRLQRGRIRGFERGFDVGMEDLMVGTGGEEKRVVEQRKRKRKFLKEAERECETCERGRV